MTKFNAVLATISDDQLLRQCIKNNELKGSISISFETEPSFFDALNVQGKESQVVIVKSEKEIAGFGIRSIKPMYVNEEIIDVGYLSGLRVNPRFRNNYFLIKGYKFFKELDKDGKVPFYLTTIIDDNEVARKILGSGRAGLPNYIPIDIYSTFVIKPQSKKIEQKHDIVRGNELSLEEIINFINSEGGKKQFYPYYKISDFNSARLRGISQNDFYIATKGSKIVGVIAKWDQDQFKQTRIIRYNRKMRIAKPFINLASRFLNIPHLPDEGELLHYFHAAFPITKENNTFILSELLSTIASDEENRSYDYFTIGLTKNDPLVEAVKQFSHREYRAKMYVVSFDKTAEDIRFLKGRTPYLELGTL